MGRTASGFSILEVLITTAILSVALLGLASLFPTGYNNIAYGGGMTTAATLGQQKIEVLRNFPFDLGVACTAPPTDLACMNAAGVPPGGAPSETEAITAPVVRDGYNFTRRTWVQIQGNAPYRFANITIILDWTEGQFGAKTFQLDARVAE
ncbi:MAG: prepilin-type N-terminal cleavage/methylation domain-containing protein [Candidatus Methylomirabilales bacterium]